MNRTTADWGCIGGGLIAHAFARVGPTEWRSLCGIVGLVRECEPPGERSHCPTCERALHPGHTVTVTNRPQYRER